MVQLHLSKMFTLWKSHKKNIMVIGTFLQMSSASKAEKLCQHCRTRVQNQVRRQYSSQDCGMPPWRVLFFGTDHFSLPHLQALYYNRTESTHPVVKSIDVVVPAQKIPGRLCLVEEFAMAQSLSINHWPIPTMEDKYDVGIVVSFGHLIPARIINMFPLGVLNVHPSLLPRWRGASPIIHSVLNGDSYTGVTIIDIRPKRFDVGPVLARSRFPVPDGCTSLQLCTYLADLGADMLLSCLAQLPLIKDKAVPQKEEGLTLAPKLIVENARVNWDQQTVASIDRQYRALGENFSLRSSWKENSIRLTDMVPPSHLKDDQFVSTLPECKPGTPVYHKLEEYLCIKCKDGWVGFRGIVLKKVMSAKSFYNGYLSKVDNQGIKFVSLENNLDKLTALKNNA